MFRVSFLIAQSDSMAIIMRNEEKYWDFVSQNPALINSSLGYDYHPSGYRFEPYANYFGYYILSDSLGKKGVADENSLIMPVKYNHIEIINREWAWTKSPKGLELFNLVTQKQVRLESLGGYVTSLDNSKDSMFFNANCFQRSSCINVAEMKVVKSVHGIVTRYGDEGKFIVNRGNFWYIVNSGDSILFAVKGDKIEYFNNNQYLLRKGRSNYLVNENLGVHFIGKSSLCPTIWQDSFLIIKKRGREGIYDSELNLKIPYVYSKLEIPFFYDDKLIISKKKGKYGVVSIDSQVKIPFQYKYISPACDGKKCYLFCRTKNGTHIYLQDSFIRTIPVLLGMSDLAAPFFRDDKRIYDINFEFVSEIPKYSNIICDLSLKMANELSEKTGMEVKGVYKIIYIKSPW